MFFELRKIILPTFELPIIILLTLWVTDKHSLTPLLQPCQRKWKIKIPDKYINSKNTFMFGKVNLEVELEDEDRDCIHWSDCNKGLFILHQTCVRWYALYSCICTICKCVQLQYTRFSKVWLVRIFVVLYQTFF